MRKLLLLLLLAAPARAANPARGGLLQWSSSATYYVSGDIKVAASSTTAQTTKIRIDGATGRIGIGTTNPLSGLQIDSEDLRFGTASRGIYFQDGSFQTTAGVGSANSISNNGDLTETADADADGAGDIIFKTGASERMRVRNAGAVGIGTSNPDATARLTISGGSTYKIHSNDATTGSSVMRLENNLGAADFGTECNNGGCLATGGLPNAVVMGQANTGPLQLETNSKTRITISTGGNVGILTNAPDLNAAVTISSGSAGLKVHSNDETTGKAYARIENSSGTIDWGIESNAGNQLVTGGIPNAAVIGQAGKLPLQFETNNTARVTIDSNGRVGIGTTTPLFTLDTNSLTTVIDSARAQFSTATCSVGLQVLSCGCTTQQNIRKNYKSGATTCYCAADVADNNVEAIAVCANMN